MKIPCSAYGKTLPLDLALYFICLDIKYLMLIQDENKLTINHPSGGGVRLGYLLKQDEILGRGKKLSLSNSPTYRHLYVLLKMDP